MCGICGIVKKTAQTKDLRSMLQKLRHRGYDSWGISSMSAGGTRVSCAHFQGPVEFKSEEGEESSTMFLMGHTRYTTKGSHQNLMQAQPLTNAAGTISLVHNGQIVSPLEGCSDSQYMLQLIDEEFQRYHAQSAHDRDMEFWLKKDIEAVFYRLAHRIEGSYACIVQVCGVGMFAFRDARGIRPLCYQTTEDSICFASESCAFASDAAKFRDVPPGVVMFADEFGALHTLYAMNASGVWKLPSPCLFEFIYLAHDDSVIDGINVAEARKLMGAMLVEKVRASGLTIDVVIPIPHTPVLAGRVLAEKLGVDFVEALEVAAHVANRRESRTFILPTQHAREEAVQNKFCLVNPETIAQCRGKRLLILDDSIVRGTTMHHVVKLIRAALEPAALYVASLSPPVINTNCFGIDIPSTEQLVARNQSAETLPTHVQSVFQVDGPVIYQDLETLKNGLMQISKPKISYIGVSGFEDSVFIPAPNE